MKIQITVKPNVRKNAVEKMADGTYRVFVKASPIEGKANAAVVEVLADFFGVSKSRVEIVLGAGAKRKVVEIR